MRPHVELIAEDDYIWHGAELIGGEGRASERRLSVDEEDGSSSLRIDFHTDWGRAAGIHHADTEYYVLSGEMTIGGTVLGAGGYVHAPKGVPVDWIRFAEGTRILHYREYGDAGFDAGAARWNSAHGDLIMLDTEAMAWDPVPNAGPMPGLFIKYLHVDPVSGFYTRLVFARPGWSDHRLAHHPCYEEAYTVQGRMTYNFGDLDPGTYFFRPARVKHGHFVAMDAGATWLLRSDGTLTNWYTQNEWLRWGGDAVNYGTERRWTGSSHDLATRPTWRTPEDVKALNDSVDFQLAQGAEAEQYLAWGEGPDRSLDWAARRGATAGTATTAATTHDHDNVLPDGPTPELRVDRDAPRPIVSTLPVRSRSRGVWDGDGM